MSASPITSFSGRGSPCRSLRKSLNWRVVDCQRCSARSPKRSRSSSTKSVFAGRASKNVARSPSLARCSNIGSRSPRRRDFHLGRDPKVLRRALRRGVEAPDGFNFIAEKVNPQRAVGVWRIYIHDSAPERILAAAFNGWRALVTSICEAAAQFLDLHAIAPMQLDGHSMHFIRWEDFMQQRINRSHHEGRRALGIVRLASGARGCSRGAVPCAPPEGATGSGPKIHPIVSRGFPGEAHPRHKGASPIWENDRPRAFGKRVHHHRFPPRAQARAPQQRSGDWGPFASEPRGSRPARNPEDSEFPPTNLPARYV